MLYIFRTNSSSNDIIFNQVSFIEERKYINKAGNINYIFVSFKDKLFGEKKKKRLCLIIV